MTTDRHFRKLENLYHAALINTLYAPTLRVALGRTELAFRVRPEFLHAAQAVHGSVYFKALDDAAFFAVNSVVEDAFVLTVSFNIYLTRPVSSGTLRAFGELVHEGRRLFVAEARLVDDEEQELARGSGSFMKSRIELTPEVGYA